MTFQELQTQLSLGEDSSRQFKEDVRNADSLASEIAAFANTKGGTIYLGVSDNGIPVGLTQQDLSRLNQLISNAASQHIRSPIAVTTQNIGTPDGKIVIVLEIPSGIDKPYFDNRGVIWLKAGADKRRVNSKEELRRLFQSVAQFHADELPTKAGIEALDKLRFRDFLRDAYQQDFPASENEQKTLLDNMNLLAPNGRLNLAAVLLFAQRPERIAPQFVIKAIRFPGNDIHATSYLDSEDFEGPLTKIFEGALAFILRNLPKVQTDKSVNSLGTPEIPPVVFEELLVNALMHRDYLISAPIRLFIFDNRIDIVSPGHLPNNLTVEKIRTGNSNIRNPILVSYIAKGLLPYRGLGSGIKRALAAWKEIDFSSDENGNLFTATISRKSTVKSESSGESSGETQNSTKSSGESSGETRNTTKSSGETPERIIALITENPAITIPEMAKKINLTERAVEKQVKALREKKKIHRVGPTKGGHWEVIEK